MRIENLLAEDGMLNAAYQQLSPLQIGLLRKIQSGRFDYDTASPQSQDAVENLIALGLVDELSMEITDRGENAIQVASQIGSVDRQNLAQAKTQQQAQRGNQNDFNEPDDMEPIENF